MNKEEIKIECIRLYKEISKYKLHADLVPRQNHYKSVKQFLEDSEWDIVRKQVYKKYKYKCLICGSENTELHVHELWIYNYKAEIQKLKKMVCLCELCHLHQHLGYSKILIKRGEIHAGIFVEHWLNVNNAPIKEFKIYAKKVFKLYKFKRYLNWKLQDCKGNGFYKKITLENVIKCI
jgi:hypothetical protein